MTKVPERFPKIEAPYVRKENDRGDYVVTDEIASTYDWVFNRADEVDAVEKIHGENSAVYVKDGKIEDAARREGNRTMTLIDPYKPKNHYLVRGIQNSTRRFSYMEKDFSENGWYFGETVGPDVHGNPYDLEENLFIPFDWLRRKATYKSYGDYSVEFKDISEWLESGIFSLFYSLMNGIDDLTNASVSNGVFVEGIVFVHPDFDGLVKKDDLNPEDSEKYGTVSRNFAKLRRDMYDWHDGSM